MTTIDLQFLETPPCPQIKVKILLFFTSMPANGLTLLNTRTSAGMMIVLLSGDNTGPLKVNLSIPICDLWRFIIHSYLNIHMVDLNEPHPPHHSVMRKLIGIRTNHYNYVIMSAVASQITSLTIAYSTVYSGTDQRKHHWPLWGESTDRWWIFLTRGEWYEDLLFYLLSVWACWWTNGGVVELPVFWDATTQMWRHCNA